ncbi:hypothetical protein GDO81_023529 [Engystomops pustulosus]|uniref:Uncharacterized protein n=1 Tax=Engystomops pustulosus TaxID=76066 RepID=A0AAV6ZHT3_ENGPU|nr:hypothetical protein GDO81_023529 [Engystomops pustulosus]
MINVFHGKIVQNFPLQLNLALKELNGQIVLAAQTSVKKRVTSSVPPKGAQKDVNVNALDLSLVLVILASQSGNVQDGEIIHR